MKKVLIHTCCAPCLCFPQQLLQEQRFEVTALWYNPNIHPFSEYQNRMNTLCNYQVKNNINIVYLEEYNLNEWLSYTKKGWENHDKPSRCQLCYTMRLEKTANYARNNGFDCFTTTLLYSKFQFHEAIKQVGEKIAEEYEIEFIYKDLREGWKKGIQLSHEYNLYRQHYCGCMFSEYKNG